MLQVKKGKATRRYERIAAAIGAVLVILVGFRTVRAESAQTREQLGNTIDYVKEQCTTYTRYNAAAVTKSLMRIMDNAQQVNRNIGYEGSAVDEDRLRFYAQKQRLTGIILLDTDGRVQCEYNGDLLNFLTLQEYIERNTVLDVVRYPQKTYASRIDLPDGSYVDISAYGRTDVPGVIVVYYHTTAEYARNYTLTIQGLLAGYNTRDETVVLLSHKKPDGHINVKVEFGEGEGKVPLDNIAQRAESYKPKERVTYKMIKEYIEAKYGFKVHTAYIAEVKRDLGLPMYDAPNAVEELKQPRKHPTPEKAEAIKDALKHFEVI